LANLGKTTIKISDKTHKAIRALADETGLEVMEVTDRLIEEGLNSMREIGKVVASDHPWTKKLENEVRRLKEGYCNLTDRMDDLQEHLGERSDDKVELTAEDLLGKPNHKPGMRDEDGNAYYCRACAAAGKTTILDIEEKPDRCPECNDKLDWKSLEAPSGKSLGWIALGVLALAFVASRARAVSTF